MLSLDTARTTTVCVFQQGSSETGRRVHARSDGRGVSCFIPVMREDDCSLSGSKSPYRVQSAKKHSGVCVPGVLPTYRALPAIKPLLRTCRQLHQWCGTTIRPNWLYREPSSVRKVDLIGCVSHVSANLKTGQTRSWGTGYHFSLENRYRAKAESVPTHAGPRVFIKGDRVLLESFSCDQV